MKVLVSRGYGAGFSTWNDPRMAIDQDLVALFESGCTEMEMKKACVEKFYCDSDDDFGPYMGGFGDLEVVEVPNGKWFKIREYDGAEDVEIYDIGNGWFYSGD